MRPDHAQLLALGLAAWHVTCGLMALRGQPGRWLLRAAWLTPALALLLAALWITQAGSWGRLLPAEQAALVLMTLLLLAGTVLRWRRPAALAVRAGAVLWLCAAGLCGGLVWLTFGFRLFG